MLDETRIRKDFPILSREIKPGIQLAYLDSAATSQKPDAVLQAMDRFYRTSNANIHRGVHTLAEEATAEYENSRVKITKFIHAPQSRQIIFTRNATEAINLVAYSWARKFLKKDDVIILTEMEHHSNLVPWQQLSVDLGIRLEFISVDEAGELDLIGYRKLLELNPKLVSFTHMSNVLGTINPAKEIVQMAHSAGALALIDAAQSVPHFPVDVTELDADFFAFSAHKMCGPTGIGVLYGKENLLQEMSPFMGGGDMIRKVGLRSYTPNELPYKFEAGTPAIAEAIGFGAAIDYLSAIGMKEIAEHERWMTQYAMDRLKKISGLKILGPGAEKRGGVVSFSLEGAHPHDIAQILDGQGIAVRAGHHCAMPLHEKYGLPATTRASFYLYNSIVEVDQLINGINTVKKVFGIS